jgi:short-subunit dehydrogenase
MKERGAGSIVNVASVAAVNTPNGMGVYSATKAALTKYSEALHVELKSFGVHVATVYPGPVATEMDTKAREAFGGSFGAADRLPMGTPESLAVKIAKAIRVRTRKVYYPEFYRSSFMFPNFSQCITEKFSPRLESLAS